MPTHISKNTYKDLTILVKVHASVESAGLAIFHKLALGLSLHPNITQMSLAFNVWWFYHRSDIKTITNQDLHAILHTQECDIVGGLLGCNLMLSSPACQGEILVPGCGGGACRSATLLSYLMTKKTLLKQTDELLSSTLKFSLRASWYVRLRDMWVSPYGAQIHLLPLKQTNRKPYAFLISVVI